MALDYNSFDMLTSIKFAKLINKINYELSIYPTHLMEAEDLLSEIKTIEQSDSIAFAVYLTGHDEETIKQMKKDWEKFKHN